MDSITYIGENICPICEMGFDEMSEFIEHLHNHNTHDPEFEKSTKKKIEKESKIRYG